VYSVSDQHDLLHEGSCIVETLQEYILSVICIAVICGVLQFLVPKGTSTVLTKIISGLVVTITVLSPLVNEQMFDWDYQFDRIVLESTDAVAEGESTAMDLLKQRIKEETETYIITKASDLGVKMTANIELSSEYPNVPIAATMNGKISPYARKQLSACIAADLGIPEDKQIWIS